MALTYQRPARQEEWDGQNGKSLRICTCQSSYKMNRQARLDAWEMVRLAFAKFELLHPEDDQT